jgi:hypothetical protein
MCLLFLVWPIHKNKKTPEECQLQYYCCLCRWGVRLCPWTAATNGPTAHLPGAISEWAAMLEFYWHGKTCPSATLSTTNPTWIDLASVVRGHGMACTTILAVTQWSPNHFQCHPLNMQNFLNLHNVTFIQEISFLPIQSTHTTWYHTFNMYIIIYVFDEHFYKLPCSAKHKTTLNITHPKTKA